MTGESTEALGGAERSQLLQALGLRLASANDPAAVASALLDEGLAHLGADTGSICVLDPDGEQLEIVAATGYEHDVMGAWATFPVSADLPASLAVRTGRAVFLRSSDERDERFPVFLTTPVVEDEATACVPLRTADGQILGAAVLGFAEPRVFTDDDEKLLNDLCVLAATALLRTTGRIQLAFLADASARLAMSLDLDETIRTVRELAVPALADSAEVYLLTDDTVDVFATAPAGEDSTNVVLPLQARSRTIGALALSNEEGRAISQTERLLVEQLAARAAVAIDNAQLFAAQQREREAAEVAEHRLRDLYELMVTLSPAMGIGAVTGALRVVSFPGLHIPSRGLWMLSDDRTTMELAPRFDEGQVPEAVRSVPLDAALPVAEAVRTREPVVVRSREERDRRFPALAGTAGPADGFVVLPLNVEGEAIGALSLGVASDIDDADLPFLVAVAGQCAEALERGRLYDLERLARATAVADRRRIQDLVSALQRSLLPPQLPEIPGAQLSACYLPGMAGLDVGGDFYDVFDTGGDWAMVIGDVCGKGPEAAALTAVARSTIRSVAMDLRQPSQVIRKLNDALHRQDLDERFCTIAYTRVVPSARGMRVVVCRGGHTAPLIRRTDGRIEPIGAIGPLIGLFAEIRVWEETASLEPGDALVLYTDGVTEARCDGEQFGDERLHATLAGCDASSADTIAKAIESAVLAFCGEPTDDTAVLVLRVNG